MEGAAAASDTCEYIQKGLMKQDYLYVNGAKERMASEVG
jgi:hypothetical protein